MKKAECQELFVVKKEDAPEIIKMKGVRGYVDEQNVAWLNVEDVARGLGFVKTEEKFSTTSWERRLYPRKHVLSSGNEGK